MGREEGEEKEEREKTRVAGELGHREEEEEERKREKKVEGGARQRGRTKKGQEKK